MGNSPGNLTSAWTTVTPIFTVLFHYSPHTQSTISFSLFHFKVTGMPDSFHLPSYRPSCSSFRGYQHLKYSWVKRQTEDASDGFPHPNTFLIHSLLPTLAYGDGRDRNETKQLLPDSGRASEDVSVTHDSWEHSQN